MKRRRHRIRSFPIFAGKRDLRYPRIPTQGKICTASWSSAMQCRKTAIRNTSRQQSQRMWAMKRLLTSARTRPVCREWRSRKIPSANMWTVNIFHISSGIPERSQKMSITAFPHQVTIIPRPMWSENPALNRWWICSFRELRDTRRYM